MAQGHPRGANFSRRTVSPGRQPNSMRRRLRESFVKPLITALSPLCISVNEIIGNVKLGKQTEQRNTLKVVFNFALYLSKVTLENKTILFKNGRVSFTVSGKGRAVVLLHGFLGAKEIWKNTIENLSKSYRVVAIDLPGHGATDNFGYAHSMELMAKCVKVVMDSLSLRKYVLVGHSMGGYAALSFTELFPEHVKGLCLFQSTTYADSDEKKKDRLRAIRLVKANRSLYTRTTIQNLFADKNLKYLKQEIVFANSFARRTSRRGIIAALHGMRDREAKDKLLKSTDFPWMFVIGEHDKALQPATVLEQADKVKNKFVLYLEHDGHYGLLESPRQSNKALRKFLRKCYR